MLQCLSHHSNHIRGQLAPATFIALELQMMSWGQDYFDSAYWFCALGGMGPCLFAHPNSGLLHFSRTAFNGTDVINGGRPTAKTPKNASIWSTIERLSAYRFFDSEVVGFSDGGALHWRVGDVGGKCGGCPPGATVFLSAV